MYRAHQRGFPGMSSDHLPSCLLKPDPRRCGSLRMRQCDNPADPGRRDPVLMSNPSQGIQIVVMML